MEITGNVQTEPIIFPVGYIDLHEDQHVNFQLNRWHSLGYWTEAEVRQVGEILKDVREDVGKLVVVAGEMEEAGRGVAVEMRGVWEG